jgi:hypothetical protein
MGEAARRRRAQASAPASGNEQADAALATVFTEGGGLVSIELFSPIDLPGLMRQMHDPRAQRRLNAIAHAFRLLRCHPPPICLLCPATVASTDALGAVAILAGDDSTAGTEPRQAICNHVCTACARRLDRAALHQAAVQFYLTNVTDLRAIDGIAPMPEAKQ